MSIDKKYREMLERAISVCQKHDYLIEDFVTAHNFTNKENKSGSLSLLRGIYILISPFKHDNRYDICKQMLTVYDELQFLQQQSKLYKRLSELDIGSLVYYDIKKYM